MQIQLKARQCVTSAPKDYDWGWTRELIQNVFIDDRNKVYRLVEVEDDYHFDCQVQRYQSGMNAVITDQHDLDGRLKAGFLMPTDKPVVIYRRHFDFETALEWPDERLKSLKTAIRKIRMTSEVTLETLNGGLAYNVVVLGDEDLFNKVVSSLEPFETAPAQ